MNGKAFSIPWIIHEYTEQGTNSDFLLVSKLTTPMFALEKQTRLEWKQTRFILMLPVAGAVFIECVIHVVLTLYLKITDASIQDYGVPFVSKLVKILSCFKMLVYKKTLLQMPNCIYNSLWYLPAFINPLLGFINLYWYLYISPGIYKSLAGIYKSLLVFINLSRHL